MSSPKIIEEAPLTMAEVKSIIKSLEKRDEELTFRAGKTKEYLEGLVVLKNKQADELYKKIMDLDIPRFKPEYAKKIIDVLPRDEEELKNLLSGYPTSVPNDAIKKIMGVVKEFLPKEKK